MTQQRDLPTGELVGQSMDRVDGRLKVTGGAKYAGEFSFPDLLHAVLVQSTIAKGKISKVDATAALAAPGVVRVLTHETAPPSPTGQPQGAGQSGPLFNDQIYFSGQNVAVIVAETLEQAERAAELIEVVYSPDAPDVVLEPNLDRAFVPPKDKARAVLKRGAESPSEGQPNVAAVYTTPAEHHNPMEPHATVVAATPDGKLTVYDATQGVFNASKAIAAHVEVPAETVHVIDPFVGGGFGCKGQSWPHSSVAATCARLVGRPVKLYLTRRQMFSSNGHRPETRQALTLYADGTGKLSYVKAEMANHTSQREDFLEPTGLDSAQTYSCPSVDVESKIVRLNVGPPTYMRAPGESSGSFSIESAMDELAVQLQIDPIELRIRNYAEKDEQKNQPYSSKSLRECYRLGAEKFGWSNRNPGVGSMRNGRYLVGYGMATATYPANFREASARARINVDGSVLIQCGTQDLGTGTYTILTQVAAQELGVSPNVVRVEIADTALPNAPSSGGSTSAASAGSAVHQACVALKQAVLALAVTLADSPLKGVSLERVQVQGGRAMLIDDPSRAVAYNRILKAAGLTNMEREATAKPGPERGGQTQGQSGAPKPPAYTMQGFGAQFCEVRVDPDLGMVRVARWVGAFALGTVLNEKTLRSQLYGGICWGIGMGLLEESLMDPNLGRYVNSNLAEYHVPVNRDIPDIEVIMVPEKDTLVNPIGVKGGGEIGITGAAAAIANAVYHATGKRVRSLPITLDKLL